MAVTWDLRLSCVTITCCVAGCGLTFAVPEWWERKRREDRTCWYCPNGHQQHFPAGASEAERERERAEVAERRLQGMTDDRNYERRRAEAQTRRSVALKGVVTRTKRRIASGKCPCCHDQFRDLGDHMATAHPGYGGD